MTKITKANEIKVPETVIGLIFGQAGTGKSTMALSMPKPLLLDTDGGIHRVQADFRCDTVQVEDYNDILETIDKDDLSMYDSIIIDTFGNLVKFMLAYFAEKDPKLVTKGGTYNIKIWGLIKQEFSSLAFKLRRMNKHLLYVAHQTNASRGDDDYFVPKSQGSAIEDCIETLDFMGYCEMMGKRRSIGFSPTGRHTGKNSIMLDEDIQVPELTSPDDNTFMVDYIINPSIERRKAEQQAKAKTDAQIKQGRELIAKSKDANLTLSEFKTMELGSYAKGVLFNELKASTELEWNGKEFA